MSAPTTNNNLSGELSDNKIQ